MKYFLSLPFWIGILLPLLGYSQVGETVSSVKLLTLSDDTVNLPFLGEKNLLLFYADPGHPKQNKEFRNYLKKHPVVSPDVDSYGIINLAAAPLIPNSLIRKSVRKEIKDTNGKVYFDPDNVLGRAWKLPDVNNHFVVIFVNKACVIEFYKAGQLTREERERVLALVKKYERN